MQIECLGRAAAKTRSTKAKRAEGSMQVYTCQYELFGEIRGER